ncbi:MAG: cation:proton antiporter subunit C [Coriobacteriia bacterium]|nr:cation:proton antiporter subunit C [Coriobacteriia bacterium]
MKGLWANIDYAASVLLFLIGLYAIIAKGNLVKKLLGLNIIETAVFAFVMAAGIVTDGDAPIMGHGASPPFANPLPQGLILTGIVVAFSTTALALSLIIRIYEQYGTIESDDLWGVE